MSIKFQTINVPEPAGSNSNNGLGNSDSKVGLIVIIIIIDNAIAMTVIDFAVIVYSSNCNYNWLNCM